MQYKKSTRAGDIVYMQTQYSRKKNTEHDPQGHSAASELLILSSPTPKHHLMPLRELIQEAVQ